MTIQPMGAGGGSEKSWPEGAVEDWQNGASYGWLKDKYGRSYDTVAKLIHRMKKEGVTRTIETTRRRRGGRLALSDQKPLSREHQSIGIRINKFREIDNRFSYQELADRFMVNRITVRHMELGLHDFTMREMQRIATIMGTNVEELMKPFA